MDRLDAAFSAADRPHLVVDPVLVATSGDALAAGGVMEAMRQHLLPAATIVTPNIPEAAALLGPWILSCAPALPVAGAAATDSMMNPDQP